MAVFLAIGSQIRKTISEIWFELTLAFERWDKEQEVSQKTAKKAASDGTVPTTAKTHGIQMETQISYQWSAAKRV